MRRAAGNGHMRCLEERVEHVDSMEWNMAPWAAARGGHDDAAGYLLDLIDHKVEASTGALNDTVSSGSRDVVNSLIAYGCCVNAHLQFPGWGKSATILHWITDRGWT